MCMVTAVHTCDLVSADHKFYLMFYNIKIAGSIKGEEPEMELGLTRTMSASFYFTGI